MNPVEFASELTSALLARGVPENTASSQVQKLVSSLTDDSTRLLENSSKESIGAMADELAEKLLRRSPENAEQSDAPETQAEKVVDPNAEAAPDAADAVDPIESAAPETSDPDDDIELIFSRPKRAETQTAPTAFQPESLIGAAQSDETAQSAPPAEQPVLIPKQPTEIPTAIPNAAAQGTFPAAQAQNTAAAPRTPPSNTGDEKAVSYVFEEDDVDKYAPGSEMLAKMGLNKHTYDRENIDTREDKLRRKMRELPVLPDIKETPQGKRRFFRNVALASPLIAVAMILYVALWGALFIVEGAIIAAFIAALVALAAAGTLAAVFGIIYGIVILSTRHAEGVFEIGLAIVVAGATLLGGVLIYNFALRLMPWVIKKTAFLCKLATRKIHIAITNYRGRLSER